jgi:hypothetical protein
MDFCIQLSSDKIISDLYPLPQFVFDYPMIAVAGGSFSMGSPEAESGRSTFECSHQVTVKDYKIGIFYKFKEELNMLKEILKDKLTTDLDEFNATEKWIALQFQSGKEGISLKKADYIVALNIDFSSSTYWQFRDRMTTLDRKENQIFWLFSKDNGKTKSIERMVYKSLMNKKDFTLNLYKKDFGISDKIKKTFSRINR